MTRPLDNKPTEPAQGIPDQVRLPLSVALGVVMQGLKIRLGRSLVTITGVACGIAFLMSILAGQLVKKGVAEEDAIRTEVSRIQSFMRADLPKLDGKTVCIAGEGAMSEVETRIAESLATLFAAAVVCDSDGAPVPLRPLKDARIGAAERADVVFLMGAALPPRFAAAKAEAVASTIPGVSAELAGVDAGRFVPLARVPTDEEIAKAAASAHRERLRNAWIAAISLLVTVIGIANAMLMSVTERFREIGTMKCLGALSSFVTRIFMLEAMLIGAAGGIVGALAGSAFATAIYSFSYGAETVLGVLPAGGMALRCLCCVAAGVVLSVVAALYPARVAAAMVPADALRSNV